MKTTSVSELKAQLSRYLRLVKRGETVVVLDRRVAVAELVPVTAAAASPFERLAREGRLKLGTQDWSSFAPKKLPRPVPIQDLLAEVREERR